MCILAPRVLADLEQSLSRALATCDMTQRLSAGCGGTLMLCDNAAYAAPVALVEARCLHRGEAPRGIRQSPNLPRVKEYVHGHLCNNRLGRDDLPSRRRGQRLPGFALNPEA